MQAGRAVEREREGHADSETTGPRQTGCAVGYDVDEKVNYFRAWTIAADEKQYLAQDTDFVEVGDTSIPIMLSTRQSARCSSAGRGCGRHGRSANQKKLLEALLAGESLANSERHPCRVSGAGGRSARWPPACSVLAQLQVGATPVEVAPNHWRWEVKDMPALDLRDIPSHPEWAALAARMSVQWGDAAVEGTDNEWRAIGEWVTTLEADRPDPSPEITSFTQALIAGAPDFYTKLSRITDSIQKNIRYFIVERGIGGLQANHAADIFRNRYGDCKDKTTLLIAMLRVAGINAYYVPVDDRRGIVDPDDPSLYGNHMITAIEIPADVKDPRLMAIVKAHDGKRYLIFDPTNERTPVGNLPSYLQGSYGTLAAGRRKPDHRSAGSAA